MLESPIWVLPAIFPRRSHTPVCKQDSPANLISYCFNLSLSLLGMHRSESEFRSDCCRFCELEMYFSVMDCCEGFMLCFEHSEELMATWLRRFSQRALRTTRVLTGSPLAAWFTSYLKGRLMYRYLWSALDCVTSCCNAKSIISLTILILKMNTITVFAVVYFMVHILNICIKVLTFGSVFVDV